MSARIADRWFAVETIGDGITLIWEPYVHSLIRANLWHVRGRDRDLLVDTGLGIRSLREELRDLFERPVLAVATHTHYDHTGGMHEFDTRLVHRLEADGLRRPEFGALRASDFPAEFLQMLADAGYPLPEELLDAYPHPEFDPAAYTVTPAGPTGVLDEGDLVDLGDRTFQVLHLPGHTPGSIGLWEAETGVLFSGDAIYDGPILDELPGSNIEDYVRTMRRLRELPVTVVHGGHDPSFSRQRLIELVDAYLEARAGRGMS